MRVWQEGGQLRERLLQDPEIGLYLTPSELDAVFDLEHTLKHVDEILARVFGEGNNQPDYVGCHPESGYKHCGKGLQP
jgi:adenylosuccinate lyase